MIYKVEKVSKSHRQLLLFQIFLLITILIHQFTFDIFSINTTLSVATQGLQNTSFTNSSRVLAIELPGWVKSGVTTVGDFLSLGANTAREAQKAAREAGTEARETLNQFTKDLNDLLKTVSDTYQENLSITIESLDDFTKNKIKEMTVAIERVNDLIQEDIKLVGKETRTIIRTSSKEIQEVSRQLEASFQNIIVVSAQSTAYVIDRTTNNGLLFSSLGMLGVGLLFFVWLLFSGNLPVGISRNLIFAFGGLYISIFSSIVMLPSFRAYAMVYSGIGLQQTLSTSSDLTNTDPISKNKEKELREYMETCIPYKISSLGRPLEETEKEVYESYLKTTFHNSYLLTGAPPKGFLVDICDRKG